MVVRIHPDDTTKAGTYQLQVWQHDVDGDRPVYTKQITLNSRPDQARDQRFWMYFLPQPIEKGLPDANNAGSANSGSLKDLQKVLQVFLYSEDGKQPIMELPLTSTLQNVDPYRDYNQLLAQHKLVFG